MEEAELGGKAFARLLGLLRAGYKITGSSGDECAFLEHPAGRRFRHWRLMLYDNGTLVGGEVDHGELRIRSYDDDHFRRFVSSVPNPD